jgi:hypothetical protein
MSPRPGLVFASGDHVAARAFVLLCSWNLNYQFLYFRDFFLRVVLHQNKIMQNFAK